MLLRSSCWRLIFYNHRSNVSTNILQHSLQNRWLSTKQPVKNSNLIWKLMAGGSLMIGVPYLFYRQSFSSKKTSHLHTQTSTYHEEDSNSVRKNLIENLPEKVPYLVIGGGPGGFSAARTIRSNDPNSRVLIVTEENHLPYSRTPLTKELWFSGIDVNQFNFRQMSGKERSIYFENEEFYLPLENFQTAPHGGVSVVKCIKVIRLDAINRKVYLNNGQEISYEKCVIATGAKPKNLKIFSEASAQIQDRVILFRTPEDYKRLHELLPKLKSLTIIGNGFTASELAFSLTERSKKIRSNVKINHVFKEQAILDQVLPEYLSKWCTERIQDENVNVIANVSVDDVHFDQNQLLLKLSNGKSLHTDLCIVDAGYEANVELAQTSNLETDPIHGGIVANAEMQVRNNLWAAGDVVSFYDQKLGRRRDCHHDNAIYTGRLAGENASSKSGAKPYIHHPRFWSDLGLDIGFEAIGLIDASLPTFSMFSIDDESNEPMSEKEKYKREGVIFYLKDEAIVGVVLWNIFNSESMYISRQVVHDGCRNQDLNEVAKLFALYPTMPSLPTDDKNNDRVDDSTGNNPKT